jgi:uncharacterized membrane protein
MTPSKPSPSTESSGIPTLSGEQNREARESTGALQRHQTQGRPIGDRLAGVVHAAVREELSYFSGPLPPPDDLIKYNEVFPDCGKTIVEMAQKEQAHRHGIENRLADAQVRESDADIKLRSRGQIFGWILALVLVCGAIYLLAKGESATGLTVLVILG